MSNLRYSKYMADGIAIDDPNDLQTLSPTNVTRAVVAGAYTRDVTASANSYGLYSPVTQGAVYVYKAHDDAYTEKYAWWIYVALGAGYYSAFRLTEWGDPAAQKAPSSGSKALARIGQWLTHLVATKTGSWTSTTPTYTHGAVLASNATAGETISWTATGAAFGLRCTRQGALGYVVVSIDGDWTAANRLPTFTAADLTAGLCRAADVGRRYINFYGSTTYADVHVPIADGLSDTSHTVKLEITGTKIAASSGVNVRLAGLIAVSASNAADVPSASRAFLHVETASYTPLSEPQDTPVCAIEKTVAGTYEFVGGLHSGGAGNGVETVTAWTLSKDGGADNLKALAAGAYSSAYSVQLTCQSTLATSDALGTVAATKRQDIVWSTAGRMPMVVRTEIVMSVARRITDAYHGNLTLQDWNQVTGGLLNVSWGTLKLGASTITLRQGAGSVGYVRATDLVATNDRGAVAITVDLAPDPARDAYSSRGSFVNDVNGGYSKAYLNSADTYGVRPGLVGDKWGSTIGFAVLPA